MTHQRRKHSKAQKRAKVNYELLESRHLLAANLYLDFGDAFTGGFGMTTNGVNQVTETDLTSMINGPSLTGVGAANYTFRSFNDVATDPAIGNLTLATANQMRAQIVSLVRRYYAPFDVNVVLSSSATLQQVQAVLAAAGTRDAYVFTCGITTAGGSFTAGLNGQAGGNDYATFGNLTDDTAVTLANNMFSNGSATQTNGATAFAYTVAHEAAHTFGLEHTINNRLSNSDIISRFYDSGVDLDQRNELAFFTRFSLPRSHNPGSYSPYDRLAANVGTLMPGYVTGTGAFDVIDVQGVNNVNSLVTVTAYDNAAHTSFLGTTSYLIDHTTGVLIEAGINNDQIRIDGTINATFTVRGMSQFGDRLLIKGNGVSNVSYLPSSTSETGLDNRTSLKGVAQVSGGATVQFEEFRSASSIEFDDFASVEVMGSSGRDSFFLGIDLITGSRLLVGGSVNSGTPMVPAFVSPGTTTRIRSLGDDDSFRVVNTTPAIAGFNFEFDGGTGRDLVAGLNLLPRTWHLTSPHSGLIVEDNLRFIQTEAVEGGALDDVFRILPGVIAVEINGVGGNDTIIGPDLNRTWQLTGHGHGQLNTSNIPFANIEKLIAGSGQDVFTVSSPGLIDIEVEAGLGNDRLIGPDAFRIWRLTGSRSGRIEASEVDFSGMEMVDGGSNIDRFFLGTVPIGMAVDGKGGADYLHGPNSPRTFSITGNMQGNVSVSDVAYSNVENLLGGNLSDRFSFFSGGVIHSLDGREGFDTLDYAARNSVTAGLLGLGDSGGASGFNGFGSGLNSGFGNIDQIVGSLGGITDVLVGANADSVWTFNPAGSNYAGLGRNLPFQNFETLVGGNQRDSFYVKAPLLATLTIVGSAPTTVPGDRLKVDLVGPTNPQWDYFAPGAGRFRFDDRMPIIYSGIETLENYDFGDAANSYKTLAAVNGPKHRLGSPLRLGTRFDVEADGLPSAAANGDDITGSPNDEDGVVLPGTLISHFRAAANVFASHASRLDAWVDFNRDGLFSLAEKIADNLPMVAGGNRIEYFVPWETTVAGLSYARFRLSSTGGLAPTGAAEDGEVEDYQISLSKLSPGTAALLADPFAPGTSHTMLVMAGTNGDDTIVAYPDNQDHYEVRINGQLSYRGPGANVTRIGSYGLNGNDTIVVTSTMLNESELYGDAGNDDLYGGAMGDYIKGGHGQDRLYGNDGHDLLFGEAGDDQLFGNQGSDILSGGSDNDRLFGGSHQDILFGGSGADWLYGQTEEDVLVGNTSLYDHHEHALYRIRDAWVRPGSYLTRVNQLRNGTAPSLASTGIRLQWSVTTIDDTMRDRLFGGFHSDWFVGLGTFDQLNDWETGEFTS